MTVRQDLGKRIEEAAAQWYVAREYRLITRNYRAKGGEIDLIAEFTRADGEIELVFVEVRARGSGGWINGLESVTLPKRRRLTRAVAEFLAGYRGRARHVRCDVIYTEGGSLVHAPNAWS